jgi:hypothetical protein
MLCIIAGKYKYTSLLGRTRDLTGKTEEGGNRN